MKTTKEGLHEFIQALDDIMECIPAEAREKVAVGMIEKGAMDAAFFEGPQRGKTSNAEAIHRGLMNLGYKTFADAILQETLAEQLDACMGRACAAP